MKLIVFSDIHGNLATLTEMMKKEQPSIEDACIYCGDLLGYYYEGQAVVALLQEIPNLYIVKGNHDNYYAARASQERNDELVEKYGSSYATRKSDVISYINELPHFLELDLAGKQIYVCHGSLEDDLEGRIYPDTSLYETEYDYIFSGHSHYQMIRTEGKTTYINPGSLGQPRDGKGFSYCVVTTGEGTEDRVEFKTANPEIERLQEECLRREGKVTYANTVLEREKRK